MTPIIPIPGHADLKTTEIDTHLVKKGGLGVNILADDL